MKMKHIPSTINHPLDPATVNNTTMARTIYFSILMVSTFLYLFQYLHLMLEGKNPLIAFLRASTHSFSSQSHTKPVSVKLLCQAWNAFARLLDINFTETFACPVCGPSPTTIICDGTLLGFRKDLMDTLDNDSPTPSTDQPIQGSCHAD